MLTPFPRRRAAGSPAARVFAALLCSSALALLAPSAAALTADGWASQNGGTTGGTGGVTVTVSDPATFRTYAEDSTTRIIQVSGSLDLGSTLVRVASNKTIVGLGLTAQLVGNVSVHAPHRNVIFKNITFTNPTRYVGYEDCISINGGSNVWIDHCTFFDTFDGLIDITEGADFVTVSWCKFYQTTATSGSALANLVGASPDHTDMDTGKLNVTWHHNWYTAGMKDRMPFVRFGKNHVYNTYFNCPGNGTYVKGAKSSEILIENCHWEDGKAPWRYQTETPQAKINATGSLFTNITSLGGGTDAVFTPPYPYALNATADVKAMVIAGAGVNGDVGSPPSAPSSLVATKAPSPDNYRQINLSWADNSNNETGFEIHRKKGSGGMYVHIATTAANVVTYSDSTCGASTTYYYRVRATNGSGTSTYTNEANAKTDQVTTGGVGRWWLDEGTGTTTADASGSGNNGTLLNGVAWASPGPGGEPTCVAFDGVDDRINCGSGSSIDNLAAVTLCAWIQPNSMGEGGKGRIFDKTTGLAPNNGWIFMVDGTNQISFVVDYGTTELKRSTATQAIGTGTWQHVAVTWTGSATATNIKFYVNGVETAYGTTTDGTGGRVNDGTASLSIGNDSTGQRTFDGRIDRASIYNRVLSTDEILAIYRSGLSQ